MLWHRSNVDARFAQKSKALLQLPPWLGRQKSEVRRASRFLGGLIPIESTRGPLARSMGCPPKGLRFQNQRLVVEASRLVSETFFGVLHRPGSDASPRPQRRRSARGCSSSVPPVQQLDEGTLHAPMPLAATFGLGARALVLPQRVFGVLRKQAATTTDSLGCLLVECSSSPPDSIGARPPITIIE